MVQTNIKKVISTDISYNSARGYYLRVWTVVLTLLYKAADTFIRIRPTNYMMVPKCMLNLGNMSNQNNFWQGLRYLVGELWNIVNIFYWVSVVRGVIIRLEAAEMWELCWYNKGKKTIPISPFQVDWLLNILTSFIQNYKIIIAYETMILNVCRSRFLRCARKIRLARCPLNLFIDHWVFFCFFF